jgi:hypothetical protein
LQSQVASALLPGDSARAVDPVDDVVEAREGVHQQRHERTVAVKLLLKQARHLGIRTKTNSNKHDQNQNLTKTKINQKDPEPKPNPKPKKKKKKKKNQKTKKKKQKKRK